ncbi:MAG: hypothetical protein JXR83_13750 [Deltaproteobacteria bacterium]|nr:hypothetical protein [Deltaproteobacteria bacterium]
MVRSRGAVLGALLLLPMGAWAEEAAQPAEQTAAATEQQPEPAEQAAAPTEQVAEPVNATAPTATATVEAGDKDGKPKFPVSASVTLDNSVGIGTFVANQYARNPQWSIGVAFRPSLTLWEKVNLSLSVAAAKNMLLNYTYGDSYMRQLTIGDVGFGVAYPELYREPVTGIGFGANCSFAIPVSMQSRSATLITAVRPALSVNWSWQDLSLNYGIAFRKNFHMYTNVVHSRNDLPLSLQYRPGGAEDLGNGIIAEGGMRNGSHSLSNSFEASYTFFKTVTAAVGLFVNNSWMYTQPLSDQYSSEYAHAAGQSDSTAGSISLSYRPWEHLGFTLGVSSQQPAFTADNKSLRFPFFDFISTSNNLSSFFLSVTGSV